MAGPPHLRHDQHFSELSDGLWRYAHSEAPHKLWMAVFDAPGPTAGRTFAGDISLCANRAMTVVVSLGRDGASAYEGAGQPVELAAGEARSVRVDKRFTLNHAKLKVQLDVLALEGGGTAKLAIGALSLQASDASAPTPDAPLYPTPGALAYLPQQPAPAAQAFKVKTSANFAEQSPGLWRYTHTDAAQKLWAAVFEAPGPTALQGFAANIRLCSSRAMTVDVSFCRDGASTYEGSTRRVDLEAGKAHTVQVGKRFTLAHAALRVQVSVLALEGGETADLLIDAVSVREPGADWLAVDGGPPLRTADFGPRWDFDETDRAQLLDVIDRAPAEWRSGFKVREFAGLFAQAYGLAHAVACGSGTAAVHAAIGALDPEPLDEVITTPVTDIGSILGVLSHNLIPVFVDWNPATFTMDPADIERKITERTRAILVVHIFGNPCDMDAIMAIAKRHGLPVIEDCAQAHLARCNGRMVGSFGEFACFSLGLKTLTTDQGGMLLTNDSALAARARGFLSKGSELVNAAWVPFARLGTFSPLTDLQAAVGISQLAKLERATRMRGEAAELWDASFARFDGFTLPLRRPQDRAAHYIYPYHLEPGVVGATLAEFVAALRAEGVQDAFGPYLRGQPLHRAPLFAEARTYGRSGFPFRDESGLLRIDYRAVRLPVAERMLPNLGFFHYRNTFSGQDIGDIAQAISKVAAAFSRRRGRPDGSAA